MANLAFVVAVGIGMMSLGVIGGRDLLRIGLAVWVLLTIGAIIVRIVEWWERRKPS